MLNLLLTFGALFIYGWIGVGIARSTGRELYSKQDNEFILITLLWPLQVLFWFIWILYVACPGFWKFLGSSMVRLFNKIIIEPNNLFVKYLKRLKCIN